MGKDIELAILFADVVGSTRLYELMGDLRARDMVAILHRCDAHGDGTAPGHRDQDHGR